MYKIFRLFVFSHTHTHINFVKIVHYYWWININYHLSDWNYWKISFHYCHCHQYCCCCCCCCCLFVLFVIDDHHLWFLFYCCFWRMFVNQVFSALNFFFEMNDQFIIKSKNELNWIRLIFVNERIRANKQTRENVMAKRNKIKLNLIEF